MKCCDVRTNSLKQYRKECMKNMRASKTYFHKKGFALVLVLKVRVFGSRKWHILVLGVVKIFCTCILDNLLYAALLSKLMAPFEGHYYQESIFFLLNNNRNKKIQNSATRELKIYKVYIGLYIMYICIWV